MGKHHNDALIHIKSNGPQCLTVTARMQRGFEGSDSISVICLMVTNTVTKISRLQATVDGAEDGTGLHHTVSHCRPWTSARETTRDFLY